MARLDRPPPPPRQRHRSPSDQRPRPIGVDGAGLAMSVRRDGGTNEPYDSLRRRCAPRSRARRPATRAPRTAPRSSRTWPLPRRTLPAPAPGPWSHSCTSHAGSAGRSRPGGERRVRVQRVAVTGEPGGGRARPDIRRAWADVPPTGSDLQSSTSATRVSAAWTPGPAAPGRPAHRRTRRRRQQPRRRG